jgi:hypothetical protein
MVTSDPNAPTEGTSRKPDVSDLDARNERFVAALSMPKWICRTRAF